MDILCLHTNAQVREEISRHLKEMEFVFSCNSPESWDQIEKTIKEKKPKIILMETKKDTRKYVEMAVEMTEKMDSDAVIIPIIKSIDRDIAIYFEEKNIGYILGDSLLQFKENLMKVLVEKRDRLESLFKERRIFKNVVYAFGFSWGRMYIADLQRREEVYGILPNLSEGIDIFIVFREKPPILMENHNIKSVWVTDIVGKNRIKPHNLTILTDSIIKFLEESERRIVVMDCVEYLLLYNDFINVMRNIELINSYAMEYNSLVILIVDNKAYTTKEYSLLKRYAIEWAGV